MKKDVSVKEKEDVKINLDIENRQKLVTVFAWLIQEDKKQNPLLYKTKMMEI